MEIKRIIKEIDRRVKVLEAKDYLAGDGPDLHTFELRRLKGYIIGRGWDK